MTKTSNLLKLICLLKKEGSISKEGLKIFIGKSRSQFYKILNEITNPEGIPPLLVYNKELDCYELGEYYK
jgi:hypothetical protein